MTTDQPFDQALLYLRAAGHDTGNETRARLRMLVRMQRDQQPAFSTRQLLERIPQWFDLPGDSSGSLSPPLARASVGYPDE